MKLSYPKKKSKSKILDKSDRGELKLISGDKDSKDKIIWGENTEALKCLLYDEKYKGKIDLVYIDPPFSTNTSFKYDDDRATTVSSSNNGKIAYEDKLTGFEFIEFLRERIILLSELMSERASIYLHIDYKIGHYVKIIMDEIFGMENFRNDITRIKCNPKNFVRKGYGNIKDLILFYSKSNEMTFNEPRIPHTKDDIKRLFLKKNDKGERYTTVPIHAPEESKSGRGASKWKGMKPPKGRHWRISPEKLDALDEKGLIEWSSNGNPRQIIFAKDRQKVGKYLQDIWNYKDPFYPQYPTQKNSDMLEMIIRTSSNENDTVLDCFAGSGSTLLAASKVNRNFIGIDSSEKAFDVIQKNLKNDQKELFRSELAIYHQKSNK